MSDGYLKALVVTASSKRKVRNQLIIADIVVTDSCERNVRNELFIVDVNPLHSPPLSSIGPVLVNEVCPISTFKRWLIAVT
jgi:hypothetical protein